MSGVKGRQKQKVVGGQSKSKNIRRKTLEKKLKLKPKSEDAILGKNFPRKRGLDPFVEGNGNSFRRRNIVKKAILQKTKSFRKQHLSSSRKDVHVTISSKDDLRHNSSEVGSENLKRKRKQKKKKGNPEHDEALRLQRRTRYLLIKVKLEQNLIDAYSAEGWKGQSREKIRPEKELERAEKQILKCKLGIREAIRQLDLLSSEGRIDDSAVAPDGSVYHEHIICAKCKLREAFPDNDIILCDGTCNCAFHQNCLEPPLTTENIPPGDEGWFCRYCKSKMDILEATNAHLGTNFPMDSNWQDVFKEEAVLPDGRESLLCQEQDWPSEDSEDDDYDPAKGESSCHNSIADSESDASGYEHSSSSLRSLEDDAAFLIQEYQDNSAAVESDEADCEVLYGPRHRKSVDYIKLNDELFGKHAPINEQVSEDEDWGPTKKKRRTKESDEVSNTATCGENESICAEEKTTLMKMKQLSCKSKRPIFRFPHNIVEKLRRVFSENELPSRTIRENLSKELGLESEKVNKWFKNARYLALKARKRGKGSDSDNPRTLNTQADGNSHSGDMVSRDIAFSDAAETPTSTNTYREKNDLLVTDPLEQKTAPNFSPKIRKASIDFSDDVSLKLLRERVKKQKKLNLKRRSNALQAETEMERLCRIKDKLEKLQDVLLRFPNVGFNKGDPAAAATLNELSVIFVPVACLREKG